MSAVASAVSERGGCAKAAPPLSKVTMTAAVARLRFTASHFAAVYAAGDGLAWTDIFKVLPHLPQTAFRAPNIL